uniref:LamG-like jellyroll fold domain-containing protein n=1 Tax=Branchiostoma floridae TaxID=7739 RepID=C3XPK6_BRAFL|eukprot:XP_002613868.1 hypothetical protein BRAFLDRAFT_72012 [Branchiostoma floridae]
MTMQAWVYPEGLAVCPIFSYQTDLKNDLYKYGVTFWFHNTESKLSTQFVDQGGKSSAEVKADVMTDGEWQFVTATYSSKTGLVKLYRNAEEVASEEVGVLELATKYPVCMAGKPADANGKEDKRCFKGRIAHMQVYNTALTQEDIKEVMDRTRGIASGLVGHWPLDSKHGARDVSGYGNHGVQFDTGLAQGPGGETDVDGAFYFKGAVGSRIEFPNNGALAPTSNMTMQAWVYPEGLAVCPIFSYQTDLKNDLYKYGVTFWFHNTESKLSTQFVDQGGKSSAEVKADVMTDGEWQFVTATYSSKTGLVKLYRNAEEVASEEVGVLELATKYPVCMAGKPADANGKEDNRCFKGRIAHMQVYNTALTQEEIKEVMDRTRGIASGLVGHWPLDSKHGARDVSGYGNDGVQFDTGLAQGPGGETDVDGAFYFKGAIGSRIEIPNNGALAPTSNMTMQAWVYPEGLAVSPIFSYQTDLKNDLYKYGVTFWFHNTESKLSTQFVDQGGKSSAEVKADVMTDGEWQFVTATYSSKTGLVKLYRNAEEVASEEVGVLELATKYPVCMAGKPADANGKEDNRCFKGRIAHMQVYNTALTQEEIKEVMDRTRGMASGLVGHWPLDSKHGARDVSGYGNHGVQFDTGLAQGPGGETDVDGAFYFKGAVGSRIEFPNNGALAPTSNMTMQAWVYPEGLAVCPIFSYQTDLKNDLYKYGVTFWFHNTESKLSTQFVDQGGKSSAEVKADVMTDGEWQFVTATYSSKTGLVKLYRNAEEVASEEVGVLDLATKYPVCMAGKPADANGKEDNRCFKGRIAHMQVYNTALTQEEIKEVMDRTRGMASSGLVGHWPLDSKHGARDVSGYGNDGVQFDTEMAQGPGGETDADGAFYFKGAIGSRIEFPNNGALAPTSYMTMQAWVYPEGLAVSPIFSYQTDLKNDLYKYGVTFWFHNTASKLSAQFVDQGGKTSPELKAEVMTDGEWQFVTATYNATTGLVKLYRNAEEVASEEVGVLELATKYPVCMAGKPADANGKEDKRCFKGRIAHMQVYNIALTPEQIKEVMDRTKKGYY